MKKLTSALTLFALIASAFCVQARNVSEDEAKKAASAYMTLYGRHGSVAPADLQLVHQIDNPALGVPALYFFNVAEWGWIIMSGSAATDPVVATADRDMTLDMDNLAPAMMEWLDDYAGYVSFVQNNDETRYFDDNAQWTRLTADEPHPAPKRVDHVFLNSVWGQGYDDGAVFNGRCPVIDGAHCVAGCVNTALAQIVYYYKYPVKPWGSVTHQWVRPTDQARINLRLNYDTMKFDYSLLSDKIVRTASAAKRNEASKLCYAIGVSMATTYNTAANGGSGAYSYFAIERMNTTFKYTHATMIYRDEIGNANFVNKVRNELQLNRPVYMSGKSTTGYGNDFGGHAWVCCGYRDNQDGTYLYYMNWGWNGSGDGFFNLLANTEEVGERGMRISNSGDAYTFRANQGALINLVPPHPDSTAVDFGGRLGIATPQQTTALQPAYPNPATHTVSIPYSANEASVLTIFNAEGAAVQSQPVSAGNGTATVDIENMPAGIYIYRLGNTAGKFVVR